MEKFKDLALADRFDGKNSRSRDDAENSAELGSAEIEASTIDLSPTTSSIKVITEATAIVPATGVSETDSLASSQTGYSRRDSLRGDTFDQPEPAAMLTADRLIEINSKTRPAPESGFRRFLYFLSLKTINLGDNLRVRERKAVDARIAANLGGGARFVPVLTRKGGVGKTTVTTLLGMEMALAREDRVIAIDANPDRGTVALS